MKLKASNQKNIGQLKVNLKKVKKHSKHFYYGNDKEKVKLTNEEEVKKILNQLKAKSLKLQML